MPLSNSDNTGVSGAATAVTSGAGNLLGGLSRANDPTPSNPQRFVELKPKTGTVGGVVGATGRGLGDTVTGVTGSYGKPVGDALNSLGNGVQDGTNQVASGVEDAGRGTKKRW